MLKAQVVVPTYNHASYLAETFDSILAQKTQYSFRILVHDDASTDDTREIIADYAARYPDLFDCVLQDENQFQQGKRIATLVWPHYKAKYIAYLDGDDIWTRPDKLQMQIDFMEQYPRCAISQTHSVFFDNATGEIVEHFPPVEKRRKRMYFEDLAANNFLLSSAVMHRRDALPVLPSDFSEISFGDYAKFALIARAGWIGLIPVEATRYRIHDKNMWFGKPYEERLAKTRSVQGYVARHAPAPFDAVWTAASQGVPPSNATGFAYNFARKRRKFLDQLLGIAPKIAFKAKRKLQ